MSGHPMPHRAPLAHAVQALFCGQSGYETVCQVCHRPSESSARAVHFYELDVPVKGFSSLDGECRTGRGRRSGGPGLLCVVAARGNFLTGALAGASWQRCLAWRVEQRFVLPAHFTCCPALTGRRSCAAAAPPNPHSPSPPPRPAAPDSLRSLLAPEFLFGDNRYSCDFCAAKVDATRQFRLRELPPMLCLSLQRFVFDFNVRVVEDGVGVGV